MIKKYMKAKSVPGFTIVELLVVIVIIGILAAISLVSYSSVNKRAIVASVQPDLSSSVRMLKMYYAENDTYPQSLDSNYCPQNPSDFRYCLKVTSGTTYQYTSSSPWKTFVLKATHVNSSTVYQATESSEPELPPALPIVFTSGGTITTSGGTRTHTFGTSCTSGSPCSITAAVSGTVAISIKGAGGGGGGSGDDSDNYGEDGASGGLSSLTFSGQTYIAYGGGGGGGGDGWGCQSGGGGSVGATNPLSLTGVSGGGSSGGSGGAGCGNGGSGGAGGRVTGNLSVTTGQTLSIVVGSGGAGGPYYNPGVNGTSGVVTISYPG